MNLIINLNATVYIYIYIYIYIYLYLRERMMLEIERDPLFTMHDIHDISKDELRERTMEKVCNIF